MARNPRAIPDDNRSVQIRLADGTMLEATSAQLKKGVEIPVDNGVHRISRNGPELIDLFTPDPARFPHGQPVTVGAFIDPKAHFQIIGATQDWFDLNAGIPRTHLAQPIPDWDALREDAKTHQPTAIGRSAFRDSARATGAAVDAARVVLRSLDAEIARLERENDAKQLLANGLVGQIEARRQEITNEAQRKRVIGLIGLFAGLPAVGVAGLALALNDDARIQQLNRDLATAHAQLGDINRQLGDYRRTKARVTEVLEGLQRAELELIASPAPAPARARDKLVRAAEDYASNSALLLNLNLQIGLLTELRDAAAAVGVNLDRVIDDLRGRADAADRALEASRNMLRELIEIVLAEDPEAAAHDWIHSRIEDQVRRAVEALVAGRGLPAELTNQIVRALMGAI